MTEITAWVGGMVAVITAFVGIITARYAERSRRATLRNLEEFSTIDALKIDNEKSPGLSQVAEEARRRVNERLANDEAERRELLEKIDQLQSRVETEEKRYRLLRAYATQGLAQSRLSFNVSLLAAGLGFLIILSGVLLAIFGAESVQAVIPIVGGSVINAVSLLFFQQDRRHQRTMFEFFERLREERKLDESLALLKEISDPGLQSRIQATLALHFAQVPGIESIISVHGEK